LERIDPNHAPVSVIIPAYNAAGTIIRALTSVALQTVKPAQVIVIDDGSNDETAKVVLDCRASMNGIALEVIRQPNSGPGAARNRALAEAACEFVAFLDADDEWMPDKLRQCLARHAKGDLCLVAHNGWVIENGCERLVDIARRYHEARDDLLHGLYRRGFISTSSVVARCSSVMDAGGFDPTLRTGQDFDLWLKMLGEPGAQFEVFDQSLTRYYVSAAGITGNTAQRLADTLAIALRHAPRLHRATGRYLASLWFRVIALHREAIDGFMSRRRYVAAVWTLLRLPANLVLLSAQAMCSVRKARD
jgi:teichuronic acid biosynthesis glycosyltransferase TuaG